MSSPEILSILIPLESKYFEIGVQLDLPVEQIKQIEAKHASKERRLAEIIDLWQINTSNSVRNWSTLADAVARIGGHDNVVHELRKRDQTVSTTCNTMNMPIPHVNSSSKADSGVDGCPVSETLNFPTAVSETHHLDFTSGCGCSPSCSLYTISAGECPNPTGVEVPILKSTQPAMRLESEDEVTERFEHQTKRIRVEFAKLVSDTARSFKKRALDVHEVALFLQHSFPKTRVIIDEIARATSFEQVFMIVAGQGSSWFNYEMIEVLIEYFGTDEDKYRMHMYRQYFSDYVTQRLPKGIKKIEVGGGAEEGREHLVIKIDREWDEVTFADLNKLRGTFASILGVRRSALYLASIQEGCIMMTFMISKKLAKRLFPTRWCCLASTQVKLLKEIRVLSLTCSKFNWHVNKDVTPFTKKGDCTNSLLTCIQGDICKG